MGHSLKSWETWKRVVDVGVCVGALVTAIGVFHTSRQVQEMEKTNGVTVWSGFLTRYDDDGLREARMTLQRNYLRLEAECRVGTRKCGDYELGRYITAETRKLFAAHLYHESGDAKAMQRAEQLDRSRRRVKNFFESVVFFEKRGYVARDEIRTRWGLGTVRMLKHVWLPVELGQDLALGGKASCKSVRIVNKMIALTEKPGAAEKETPVSDCVGVIVHEDDV